MAEAPKIYSALIAAQKAMGPLLKTETNPHFRSKYANLAGVIETITDALHENGLVVIQTTGLDMNGEAVLITKLAHESGEVIESMYPLWCAAKNDPQKLGSAMTYARRYSLMAIVGIAPEDDDGNSASPPRPKDKASPSSGASKTVYKASPNKPASVSAKQMLSSLFEKVLKIPVSAETKPKLDAMSVEKFGKSLSELSAADVSTWIDELKNSGSEVEDEDPTFS